MMSPKFSTLPEWAASLVIDFPTDNIPFLANVSDWKEWGNNLIQETSFADSGAPGTGLYDECMSWMEAVFLTMANF